MSIRCLGSFLLILHFIPATLATPVQSAQAAQLAQAESSTRGSRVECNVDRKEPTELAVEVLAIKAKEYIANPINADKEKALEALVEVFKLSSTLKDVQARENIVQGIIVIPNSLLDNLVTLYVESGQKAQVSTLLSQALPVIQSLNTSDRFIKTSGLTAIARHYTTIGQPQNTLGILPQSLQSAKFIERADLKPFALTDIAEVYIAAKKLEPVPAILEEALQFTKFSQSEDLETSRIATVYAKAGQYERAIQVAQNIANEQYFKNLALGAIASQYAETGQLEQAFQLAQTLEESGSKANALSDIAVAYAKAGQQDKAFELFSQAVELMRPMEQRSLSYLITRYAEAGQPEAALQVAQSLKEAEVKAFALAAIALSYAKTGQQAQASEVLSQAVESMKEILPFYTQNIVSDYLKAGQHELAFRVTQSVETPPRILAAIANQFLKAGQTNRATQLYSQAMQVANSAKVPTSKVEGIAGVALEYAISGQRDKASQLLSQSLGLAATLSDSSANSSALRSVVDEYIYAGQYDFAFQIAQAMLETSSRNYKLQDVGKKYIEVGEYDKAIQVVKAVQAPEGKVKLLVAIASKYIESGQTNKGTELLAQALPITRTIEGPESREIVVSSDTTVDDDSDRGSLLEQVALKYAEAGEYNQGLSVAQILENPAHRDRLIQRLACYRQG